jgi:hypothetical protein
MLAFAKQLLTDPRTAWAGASPDRPSTAPSPLKFLLVLATLPALGAALGALSSYVTRDPIFVVARTATSYLLALGLVFGFSRLVRILANAFESRTDPPAAERLAIFSATPWLVYGALAGLPWVGGLVQMVALCHCGYLFALGAPVVIGTPEPRSVGFASVAILGFVIAAGTAQTIAGWVLTARLLPVIPSGG